MMQPYQVYHTDSHSGNIMVPPGDSYLELCKNIKIIDSGNVEKNTDDLVLLSVLAHALFRFAERSELIATKCGKLPMLTPSEQVRVKIAELLAGRDMVKACKTKT